MARKSKVMWVRVTPKMDQYIRTAADYHDVEIAEIIRRALLEYMLAHPVEATEEPQQEEEPSNG